MVLNRFSYISGNTLGFYGGLFGPTGDTVLGHSYHGAFHIWKNSEKLNCWLPCVTLGGHFGEVIDCAWEPQGHFLFTLSSDQTTRIHAPWKTQNKKVSGGIYFIYLPIITLTNCFSGS